MANSGSFQLFNLATMSGVFPGVRTMIFQRLRLQPAEQPAAGDPAAIRWARLLWYDDPVSCVLELDPVVFAKGDNLPGMGEQGGDILPPGLGSRGGGDIRTLLIAALHDAGWTMRTCGACAFWQPLIAASPDGLPNGRCSWRATSTVPAPPMLAAQSMLALDCLHWQLGENTSAPPTPQAWGEVDSQDWGAPITPMRKRAEQETNERWTWWGRLRRRFAGKSAPLPTLQSWENEVVERSGVGAGTEPCFACQGRIANLGALAVATPEGDKQTFSVWRCRACYTYYLNDWIDRWERTDNLETEERYYRLAPAEAIEVLAVIDNVVDAEHPARRHERHAQRAWVLQFIGQRSPLSHQIKQGR